MNEDIKKDYSVTESIYAWFCFATAYVFCRFFPVSEAPLGSFLLTLILFTVTTVVSIVKGAKLKLLPVITGVTAIIISASLVLCSNDFVYFFAYTYVITAYCYYVFTINGNAAKKGFNDLIIADFIKALFVVPFCSLVSLFRGMFSGRSSGRRKAFLKILLGIAIAVIPTGIVVALLSYDKSFTSILHKLFYFNFTLEDFTKAFLRLHFSIPVAMYVYGLFISSVHHKCSHILTENTCTRITNKVKIIPAATALTAVIPLLAVYIIFFISQWNYYISGFTKVLPDNLSYAEYAREGFFQLCAVSMINLILIVIVMIFMKQKDRLCKIILKSICVVYSIVTLILISTALSKMFMYIDYYGLTQKRVYSTWLMAVIAIIFIMIIIRQFVPSFQIVIGSCTVCVVMFMALSVVNADNLIAKYNINCYINGKFDEVDVYALIELGDSAIPELVRLSEELDDRISSFSASDYDIKLQKQLMRRLEAAAPNYSDSSKAFSSYTLPYIQAQKALERINLIE